MEDAVNLCKSQFPHLKYVNDDNTFSKDCGDEIRATIMPSIRKKSRCVLPELQSQLKTLGGISTWILTIPLKSACTLVPHFC